MYQSIQLTKTTSSRRTSQVTRPGKNLTLSPDRRSSAGQLRFLRGGSRFRCFFSLPGWCSCNRPRVRAGLGRTPAASSPHAICHTATLLPNGKVLVAGGDGSGSLSRARNSTIRRAGPGRPPAASPPHAMVTRRRCCPTARCSSQAVADIGGFLASAELYDPASGTWTATGSLATGRAITRRRCCPTARCSSQAVTTSAAISRARNSTIRRAGPGRPPAASPPHAISHGDVAAQRQGARRRRL